MDTHDSAKQPPVFTRHLSRRLSEQNCSLGKTWKNQLYALEKEQSKQENKIDGEIMKMLQYRNSLTDTTGLLKDNEQMLLPSIDNSRRNVSFSNVCEHVMEMAKEANSGEDKKIRSKSLNNTLSKETASSESKKTLRRKSSVSLLELQRFLSSHSPGNVQLSEAIEKNVCEDIEKKCNYVSMEEGGEVPIRLPPLNVAHFPKLYTLTPKKPEIRSFEKDEEFIRKATGKQIDYSDIKYCRYLRVPPSRYRKSSNLNN